MPRVNLLFAIGALAGVFILKLIVLSELSDHPLLQPDAGLDTSAYVELAKRVLSGDLGLSPGLYYVSPLYIYFLALAYGLAGSFAAVQVVQVTLGTVTVWCVFVMARVWGGVRAGWIAGALAAGCGVLTFHEIVLMQSALDPFLTACGLTSLTMALRPVDRAGSSLQSSARWYFLTGLCFGIQALNRPQVLLPVLVVAVVLAGLRRVKPAVLVGVGLTAALLPVAARNVVVSGQWSLVSSHGGLNFYIGNHQEATGLYQPIPGIRPEIEGQREDTRRVAEAAVGRALTDTEVSDYFFERGWRWIREQPMAAVQLFAAKLVLAIHADHVALPHSFEFFAHDARTSLRWLVLNPWIIMPLGIAGLLFARPRPSDGDSARFLVWTAFVPAYALALAVFFLAERYRLPLLIPMCVSAGMFVDWLWRVRSGIERMSTVRWMFVAGSAALIALAVNWPFQLADAREGDRLRMVQHAVDQQDIIQADRWATLLVTSAPAPARLEERIGAIFLGARRPREAAGYLKNAVAHGGSGAELAVALADAEHQMGNASGSVATLRSTDWSAATSAVQLRAGRVAAAVGANDLAVALFTRVTEAEPKLAEAWAQLGFALMFSGRTVEAERALLEAIRQKPSDAVVLGGLAVSAARLGRSDEALARANAALAIDPGEPLARQVRAALATVKKR